MQPINSANQNLYDITVQNLSSFKQKIIHITKVIATYVIELIRAIVNWVLNKSTVDNQKVLPPVKAKGPQSSAIVTFTTLTPAVLKNIFSKLDISAQIEFSLTSPAYHKIAEEYWTELAKQLNIPLVAGKCTGAKIANLLSYFEINPATKKATILKNDKNIEKAIGAYPTLAYLIVPIPSTPLFNFYYKEEPTGKIVHMEIDKDIKNSKAYATCKKIVEDGVVYTKLTLKKQMKEGR
jgi:hypothetical protein